MRSWLPHSSFARLSAVHDDRRNRQSQPTVKALKFVSGNDPGRRANPVRGLARLLRLAPGALLDSSPASGFPAELRSSSCSTRHSLGSPGLKPHKPMRRARARLPKDCLPTIRNAQSAVCQGEERGGSGGSWGLRMSGGGGEANRGRGVDERVAMSPSTEAQLRCPLLLVSKSHGRVDSHGAPGRKVAREDGDYSYSHYYPRKCRRVVCADPIE